MPAVEIAAALTGLWWIVNICMPGNRSIFTSPPSQDKILILLCCRVDCRWSSFNLSDVQPLPWNRPVATFMAKNRFYYIDVFRCGGAQHQHLEGGSLDGLCCSLRGAKRGTGDPQCNQWDERPEVQATMVPWVIAPSNWLDRVRLPLPAASISWGLSCSAMMSHHTLVALKCCSVARLHGSPSCLSSPTASLTRTCSSV